MSEEVPEVTPDKTIGQVDTSLGGVGGPEHFEPVVGDSEAEEVVAPGDVTAETISEGADPNLTENENGDNEDDSTGYAS